MPHSFGMRGPDEIYIRQIMMQMQMQPFHDF